MSSNEDLLYNLLKQGETPESLTAMLNSAQKKIDEEAEAAKKAEAETQAREEAIKEAKNDLIDAIEWFYISIGDIAPAEDDAEGWKKFHEEIVATVDLIEKYARNTKVTVKKLTSDEAKKEIDNLVNKYKSLPFFSDFLNWF